jgi:ferrous iron transport protein B
VKLSEVKYSETVIIIKILGHGSFRRRISEMGFVKGKEIKVIKNAPFKGPFEFKILDYNISLRKSEADLIEVVPSGEYKKAGNQVYEGVIDRKVNLENKAEKGRIVNIALAGNPNCGKTTLFNYISGSKERVGNYGGVTIDIKKAKLKLEGYTFNFYDLPGTYSLTAYSTEEIFVRRFIYEQTPDIVVNVIDSTNLERNLFLTTQLIDMDLRIVGALNMYDELERKKIQFDYEEFSRLLGIPIVPTISSKGIGLKDLMHTVIDVFEGKNPVMRHIHINYGKDLEDSIGMIRQKIKEDKPITDKISSRFLAIKLLEKDPHVNELLSGYSNYSDIRSTTDREIKRIESLNNEGSETVITNSKYGFIAGALKETYRNPFREKRSNSDKIDDILTHKYLGFPIFVAILFVMFHATFSLGAYPMDWIDRGVLLLGNFILDILPEGMLTDLIVNGIIGGAGSVLIFLPNILILFFFISLLEETGYMARASFIMDKIMHRFGLHGRSFIPLIMGFGCNVPAILATRTMRDRSDRLLTMMIIPFMSCSARLPVYILIISAFFNKYHALILISIYATGILFAFITAQILNKTVFRNKSVPFVMELPPYRLTTPRNILFHVWDKAKQYLKKIGTVIMLGVIIIWALEYFPRETLQTQNYQHQLEAIKNNPDFDPVEKERLSDDIRQAMEADRMINSWLGRIGKCIEPVMRPLGFDWKMSIALVAGLPAKEIIVSTMGVIYQSSNADSTVNLQQKLKNEVHSHGFRAGEKVFTLPAALAFLIFILLYFPCVGVIATIKNEAASWKWALFVVFYTTGLAWIMAWIVYNFSNSLI